MDKKEESSSKGKKAADEKQAETGKDDNNQDKKEQKDDDDEEVAEKFGEPDYAAIAPDGEFDLYNVSEHECLFEHSLLLKQHLSKWNLFISETQVDCLGAN
jgi:hypothetical protein